MQNPPGPPQPPPFPSRLQPGGQPSYDTLAQNARLAELKRARNILIFLGIITLLFQGFLFLNAQNELDDVYREQLKQQGGLVTLEQVRAAPPDKRVEFDRASADDLRKVRLIYGATLALGVVFIGCGLLVYRMPVVATMTGLVLFIGKTAAEIALDMNNIYRGIVLKVIFTIGLIAAVKAALAYEKHRKSARS